MVDTLTTEGNRYTLILEYMNALLHRETKSELFEIPPSSVKSGFQITPTIDFAAILSGGVAQPGMKQC